MNETLKAPSVPSWWKGIRLRDRNIGTVFGYGPASPGQATEYAVLGTKFFLLRR